MVNDEDEEEISEGDDFNDFDPLYQETSIEDLD